MSQKLFKSHYTKIYIFTFLKKKSIELLPFQRYSCINSQFVKHKSLKRIVLNKCIADVFKA